MPYNAQVNTAKILRGEKTLSPRYFYGGSPPRIDVTDSNPPINVLIKQVCTNGLVSFGSAITTSSGSIPRGSGPAFIAANWYDFHTHRTSYYNKGRVYYRSTSSGRIIHLFAHLVRGFQNLAHRLRSSVNFRGGGQDIFAGKLCIIN